MIQYKSWNSFSPLSADAAEWAIENKHLFPVGNVNLWTGEEEDGTPKGEIDIELFDEPDGEDTKVSLSATVHPEDEKALADELPSDEAKETEAMEFSDVVSDKTTDEDDFEITAEELAGIEFVPTATRMQGSQYGATAKGKKVNFKTILVKGILWALIGAILAFGVSEILDKPTSSTAILGLMGETELERFSRANDRVNELAAKYMDKYGEDFADSMSPDEVSEFKTAYSEYENSISALSQVMDTDEVKDIISKANAISTAIFSLIIGLVLGLLLGIGEGVYYGSKDNALKYALIGMGVGALMGFIGGYLGQEIYRVLLADTDEYTSKVYLAFVRAMGWTLMGGGVGISAGLIKPEKMRILNCTLGGLIGGFLGGFAFNFVNSLEFLSTGASDTGVVPRFIGIVIMGVLIGLGIGLLEQFAKAAWLKVIRGEFEGKEYLVFEGKTTIGNSGKNTIVLFKDKLVAPMHCEIIQEGNKYVLVDKGSPMGTLVNGMRVSRHVLKQGDAISLGNSVLVFNTK